jgi:hypothetical protein
MEFQGKKAYLIMGTIAGGLIFVLVNLLYLDWWKSIIPSTESRAQKSAPVACVESTGRIWTGVMLYRDQSCSTPVATVMGGKKGEVGGQVMIKYLNSGSEEWKNRDAIKSGFYVKQNDTAIANQLWMEY